MNDNIKNYLSRLRNPKALIVLGTLGMLLILLSSFMGSGDEDTGAPETEEITAREYCEMLEESICKIVTDITGSKNVTAVVTLESGIRYSYADTREEASSDKTEKESQSSDSELKEGYITVKTSDGGEQALLITTEMPEIRGVAIVCEGGDSEIINEKILNAVTSALNITSKRVYICGRKAK